MTKRQVVILATIAILLTVFSIALAQRDSRDWRANRTRRLFPFPWQDTAAILINRPNEDEDIALFRKPGGEWQIAIGSQGEFSDSLNPAAVQALAALATLSWREPAKDRQPPDPDKTVILDVTSRAGQKVAFAFGDVKNNLRATLVDNDNETIYGVNQDLLAFLDWPRERFRNFHLAGAPDGSKPKKITLIPDGDDQMAITLELTPAGWRQTVPVAWPVDEGRLDLLLQWLDRLRGDAIEAEQTGDLEWFGFTPKSTRIDVFYNTADGEIRRQIEIGKESSPGHVYARDKGRNPIFSLPTDMLAEISLNVAKDHPVLWRNFYRKRDVNILNGRVPDAVVIERLLPTPEKLTVTQLNDAAGQHWQATFENAQGTHTYPLDPPDLDDPMRPLSALFTGLSSLRVKTFLADVAPGEETGKWTAYPAWRFTVRMSGADTVPVVLTLYAEDKSGNLPSGQPFAEGKSGAQELVPMPRMPDKVGFAFSLSNRPAVMETFGEMSYLLCLPPYRYRSAKIIDSRHNTWSRVELIQDGKSHSYKRKIGDPNEQWWLDGPVPEPLMDDNNAFINMLLELGQLRTDGFVAEGMGEKGEFGLDRPAISAIVYSSSAEAGEEVRLFRLDIGAKADAAGKVYARLNEDGPVFLLSGRMAGALGETYH